MCLSTPTTAKANGSTTNCVNNSSDNSGGTCATTALLTANGSSSSSGCSLSTVCDSNGTTVIHRKTKTANEQDIDDAIKTKDLEENLGYKEENAVYKEHTRPEANATCFNNNNICESKKNDVVDFKPQIRWPDLLAQLFLHSGGLYGLYLLFYAQYYTFLWMIATIWVSGVGITAGAHRLWSHKSYKASLPLRILLVFMFSIAGQRDAYTWALDHRIHHKFSETDADPHNAKRGFWFAHVGWLFLTPHPKVAEKRQVIDMSDLENDGVVMFQRKFYLPIFALLSILLPTMVPWYFWHENLWFSFWINFNLRFCCTLNIAFFVNSVAHMWGKKPYDKNIMPVEAPLVSLIALGEGWHNYHHVFPWDYKTGEFGNYTLNVTTAFIDLCAKLGLASGRKFVSADMIERRAKQCGDGTRFLCDEHAHDNQVWGYGDRDLPKEDLIQLVKMRD